MIEETDAIKELRGWAKPIIEREHYIVWEYFHSGYQLLTDIEGTEIVCITEPEDRSFYRDLAPILDELERLRTQI